MIKDLLGVTYTVTPEKMKRKTARIGDHLIINESFPQVGQELMCGGVIILSRQGTPLVFMRDRPQWTTDRTWFCRHDGWFDDIDDYFLNGGRLYSPGGCYLSTVGDVWASDDEVELIRGDDRYFHMLQSVDDPIVTGVESFTGGGITIHLDDDGAPIYDGMLPSHF